MPFTSKNIRLAPENYIGKRVYFVTICCDQRKPVFRDADFATCHVEVLRTSAAHAEFAIHAYCLMPDHLHFLAEGLSSGSRLLDFVYRFKQKTAFEYRRKFGVPLWQVKFYDHILRSDVAMEDVAWYIWMNPVRKGLSRDPWDYPHSGSFTMPWKKKAPAAKCWRPPWKKPPAL